MKTIIGNQTFKKVSAKQAELFPVLASKLGIQRPAVKFDLPEYEAADLEMLATSHGSVMLTCLNEALSQFAKAQFAANPTDWEFKPSLESLSLEALAASFESTSRGRVLTLDNANKLATWLTTNLAAIVTGVQVSDPSYQATNAQAIIAVVLKYTTYESKGAAFLEKVVMRLNQLLESIMDSEDLLVSFSEEPNLAAVFEALIKKFSRADEAEISEDAL